MARITLLPLSQRPLPKTAAWFMQENYLLEVATDSLKTETTYRSGLRLFADWVQLFNKEQYTLKTAWPLYPDHLTTATVLEFRVWLAANRSIATVTTYMAAVTGYLEFIDGMDLLPEAVQLGKLQRQMKRRQIMRNISETVVNLEYARESVPQIVNYFDALPLPETNDKRDHRLALLRNRALMHTLYSTAARISEVAKLNRQHVDYGRAKHVRVTGKGNKTRTLHLREYARQAIQAYLQERQDTNPALFVAHSNNTSETRLSITSIHLVVKSAVTKLGLHQSLSAHDFRHYRATQLLKAGMPIEVIQEYLGHADISTTRTIYAPLLGVEIVDEWLGNFDVTPKEASKSISTSFGDEQHRQSEDKHDEHHSGRI